MNEKSKILFTISVILIVGAVMATAGQITGTNLIIQADTYKSSDGSEGITETVNFTDLDGTDLIMTIKDGLIVNVSEVPGPEFPSEGLVSYYKLNNITIAIDSLGNFSGTNNGAESVGGVISSAYDFNKANGDDVSISSSLSNAFDGDFTISLWVKRTNDNVVETFFSSRADNDTCMGIELLQHTVSGDILAIIDVGGSNIELSKSTLDVGYWHHVAVRRNGTLITLWVDNITEDSDNSTGNDVDLSNSNTVRFGEDRDGTWNFDGNLDEIGIWERALSNKEIETLYNDGDGLTYTP